MNSDYDKIVKLNSFIVAIVVLSSVLSGVFAYGFGKVAGANLYALIAIVACYIIKIVKQASSKVRIERHFTYRTVIILLLLLALYLLTILTSEGKHNYSVIQLIFYAIIPILVTTMEFRTEYVLRYAVYLSLLTVVGLDGFFAVRWTGVGQADMGSVYSIVTALVCTLFHIRYYGNKANLLMKICYIYNGYLFFRVIMLANRGALLTLLFAIFVSFIYKFDNNDFMKMQTTKKIIIISFTIIFSIIVMQNLEPIIKWLIEACKGLFDKVPAALLKMEFYIKQDNISNGRSAINEVAYKAIMESPIYGHGLNMFNAYTNYRYIYTHNFILQFLFEGGILFAAIPVFLVMWSLVKVLLGMIKDKETFVSLALFLCLNFPRCLISGNPWKGTDGWLLIGFAATIFNAEFILKQKKIK